MSEGSAQKQILDQFSSILDHTVYNTNQLGQYRSTRRVLKMFRKLNSFLAKILKETGFFSNKNQP